MSLGGKCCVGFPPCWLLLLYFVFCLLACLPHHQIYCGRVDRRVSSSIHSATAGCEDQAARPPPGMQRNLLREKSENTKEGGVYSFLGLSLGTPLHFPSLQLRTWRRRRTPLGNGRKKEPRKVLRVGVTDHGVTSMKRNGGSNFPVEPGVACMNHTVTAVTERKMEISRPVDKSDSPQNKQCVCISKPRHQRQQECYGMVSIQKSRFRKSMSEPQLCIPERNQPIFILHYPSLSLSLS